MKRFKILFVYPILGEKVHVGKGKKKRSLFPPLNLLTLAALSPKDVDIELQDENIQDIDFGTDADLVAITALTASANNAYAMADTFRSRGKRVVLGGMHVSALPEEATEHADAVCVGEAESFWLKIVNDARNGSLEPRYSQREVPKEFWTPDADRDIYIPKKYLVSNTLQTTRGCPFACDFCSVTEFFGREYRCRPIDAVVKELEQFRGQLVGFVDDNIIGRKRHAKEFFRAIKPLGLKWVSQASINVAKDDELLRLAKESGCIGLFIGFESLIEENLESVNKGVNKVGEFKEAIAKIQSYGIAIEGAFIFGLDGDEKDVFKETVNFAKEAKLAAAQFGILTPFPGTGLYARLEEDGRIFDRDWTHYDISRVVFHPAKMSPQELQDGFAWAWREFYSWPSIVKRLGFRNQSFAWKLNIAFRISSKKGRYDKVISAPDHVPNSQRGIVSVQQR